MRGIVVEKPLHYARRSRSHFAAAERHNVKLANGTELRDRGYTRLADLIAMGWLVR